jgi:excisionase family DNA binding protein
MPERDYYVTSEVSKALDVNRSTAIRLSEQGKVPGMYRVGSRYRWGKDAFDAYLKRQKKEQAKRA